MSAADSRRGSAHWQRVPAPLVFMPSPVSLPHSDLHGEIYPWIWLYKDLTPGCHAGIDCTWVMGPKDVPQPDIFLRVLPEYGGQSNATGEYAAGAPELVVEISGSSLSRDLGVKLDLYRRAGVREYLTVVLRPRQVIWRYLARNRYREIAADDDGLLRSRIFPGLWLDPNALWNPKRSLRTALEAGTRSAEHAAFVRSLAAHKRKP
jgi:Uma2 family endonuclease